MQEEIFKVCAQTWRTDWSNGKADRRGIVTSGGLLVKSAGRRDWLRQSVFIRQDGVLAATRARAVGILRTGGAHPSGGVPPTLDFSFSKRIEGE